MTAGVLAILCVIVVMFASLPDQLILFPTTNRIDPRGAVRKTVPFENGELEIWTAQSRRTREQGRADIFILRFYGNADRADRKIAKRSETMKFHCTSAESFSPDHVNATFFVSFACFVG